MGLVINSLMGWSWVQSWGGRGVSHGVGHEVVVLVRNTKVAEVLGSYITVPDNHFNKG